MATYSHEWASGVVERLLASYPRGGNLFLQQWHCRHEKLAYMLATHQPSWNHAKLLIHVIDAHIWSGSLDDYLTDDKQTDVKLLLKIWHDSRRTCPDSLLTIPPACAHALRAPLNARASAKSDEQSLLEKNLWLPFGEPPFGSGEDA